MKKLKQQTIDWAQIDRFVASAEKKVTSAHKILAFDEEACLQQAYEAMLKASLGFMFSHGFRARSQPGHHIAIIDFVRARIRHLKALIPIRASTECMDVTRLPRRYKAILKAVAVLSCNRNSKVLLRIFP